MKSKNIKFLWLILLTFFTFFFSFAQEKIFYKEYTYDIKNEQLKNVLNEFIEHEKQYDYYDSLWMFRINIFKEDSTITFFIQSGSSEPWMTDWKNFEKEYYFVAKYNSYYFIVNSNVTIQNTDTIFFTKTSVHYELKVHDNNPIEVNNSIFFEDDRYLQTVWMYYYRDGNLNEWYRRARNYGKKQQ